jgi:plastocyanin
MKKLNTFIILCMAWMYSNATIHTVLVADFSFIPASVNAVCGDTVAWVWSSGTHTTTSTSVPTCATPWNAPVTSTQSTFSIVIPCEGVYNYYCTVHPQMTANIIATCATGIDDQTISASLLAPNPFNEIISVTYQDNDRIVLYNMLGNSVKAVDLIPGNNTVHLDLAGIPRGIYFLGFFRKGALIETRKIAKE